MSIYIFFGGWFRWFAFVKIRFKNTFFFRFAHLGFLIEGGFESNWEKNVDFILVTTYVQLHERRVFKRILVEKSEYIGDEAFFFYFVIGTKNKIKCQIVYKKIMFIWKFNQRVWKAFLELLRILTKLRCFWVFLMSGPLLRLILGHCCLESGCHLWKMVQKQ